MVAEVEAVGLLSGLVSADLPAMMMVGADKPVGEVEMSCQVGEDQEQGQGQGQDGEGKTFLVDDVIDEVGFGKYQMQLMLLCGLGWATDIMDLTMLSYLIPTLAREWGDSLDQLGTAAELTFLGMMCGSLFWGMASDRIGRKPAFMLTSLVASCAGLLSATAGGLGTFAACRFVQGFGLGGNLAVDFAIFLENIPTKSRGRMTTFLTVFATLGSLSSAGLAWVLMESAGWRVYVALCCSPGLVIAGLRAFMMESPHFLASVGRAEECHRVLTRVAAINKVALPVGLTPLSLRASTSGRAPLREEMRALLGPGVLRGRLAMTGAFWFMLAYGFYGFSVWGASYFQERGFVAQQSYAALFTSVACQVPGTLTAVALVERVGRRPLLVAFSLGCSVSILGFAITSSHATMLVSSLALNFNTAALWAVTYTFTPEIFPTRYRTSALGMCAALARVAAILASAVGGAAFAAAADGDSAPIDWSLGVYSVTYLLCALLALAVGVDMTGVRLSAVDAEADGGTAVASRRGEEYDSLAARDALIHDRPAATSALPQALGACREPQP